VGGETDYKYLGMVTETGGQVVAEELELGKGLLISYKSLIRMRGLEKMVMRERCEMVLLDLVRRERYRRAFA
jgi:hypothetical protein